MDKIVRGDKKISILILLIYNISNCILVRSVK